MERDFLNQGLEAPCREIKNVEKSGLEPTAPSRLADRKHCALTISFVSMVVLDAYTAPVVVHYCMNFHSKKPGGSQTGTSHST